MSNENSSFKKSICCLYQPNYSLLLSITILAYLILSSCNIQKREEPQQISNSKVTKDKLKNLKIAKESTPTELTFKVPPMPATPEAFTFKVPPMPATPEAFTFKIPPMPIIPESINSSNESIALKAIPLSGEATLKFLDVRGVGDSGMGYTHTQPYKLTDKVLGVNANFAERLDNFDPTGKSYRGDLSFINWESSVGTDCKEFWAPRNGGAFAFMSHPDNLIKAYQKGFNLIGLANNHTRDCPCADNWENGALVSAKEWKFNNTPKHLKLLLNI